jgi:predicted hotdog family 3-hydroxylacyl-ACP dehydratase
MKISQIEQRGNQIIITIDLSEQRTDATSCVSTIDQEIARLEARYTALFEAELWTQAIDAYAELLTLKARKQCRT